jgi:hypothetical protein
VDETSSTSPPPQESKRARQRRLKRKPGRPRNPALEWRFEPTPEQRQLVQLLVGVGISHEQICKCIRSDRVLLAVAAGQRIALRRTPVVASSFRGRHTAHPYARRSARALGKGAHPVGRGKTVGW